MFVAEKSGLVKVFDSLTDPTPTIFADLRTNVYNFWDRGLLGPGARSGLPGQPVRLRPLHLRRSDRRHRRRAGERWAATADDCPTPPGATTDGCVVSGRLSRLQAAGNAMTGSEQVLIEDWCQQFPSHSVGTLAVRPGRRALRGRGDGASFDFVDYGQTGDPAEPVRRSARRPPARP